MEKKEMLYEGKAKKVYTTEDPDVLIVSYKDDATAFNGLKKGTIVGKGAINNRMTNFIFKKLEEKGVPTHLVEELNDRETAVKNARLWNSAIRTTNWATRLSTAITHWHWDLPPRRRLTISLSMRLR